MEAEGSASAGPSGSGGVRGAGEAGRGVAGGSAPIASVSTPAKDDDVHDHSSEAMVVVLERQLHAVKINEGDAVQGAFDQLRDLYVKLSTAGVDYPKKINCYKALSLLPESWGPLVVNLNGMKDSCVASYLMVGGLVNHQLKALRAFMELWEKAWAVRRAIEVSLHHSSHWVIDTGAFMTMTNQKDLLDEVRPSKAATVISATGQVVPVRGEGRAMFMIADGRLVELKRVLLVPRLCANLLSTKALSEAGMKMEMMGTKVFKATLDGRVLWDLRGGKDMHRSMWEILVLPWKEAAARLDDEVVRGVHASHVTSGEVVMAVMVGCLCMGGLLYQVKFSQFPLHSAVGQSSDPVDLVHVDLVGPMKVKGDGGALYSMTMVDDYTRLTWPFPLAKKSDAARVIIEEWLPMVERESSKRVKAIRSDRGGDFLGAEFRTNQTIIEGGRTILVDSGLPLRFWPLTICHTTVIKNRLLTHVGGQHWVSMEKWSGKKPLVDMLRVFGCMGLVHAPKEKREKLQAAAVWAVHLGLARGSKGWLMWDPKSNIFTTRDAKFMEGLMFKEWSERGRSKVTIPLGIEAPVAERGDTEEEVQQPTPSPKLPPRRTTQGKRDAARGGAKEGAAKERPKRAAHPRDFLKYERLRFLKALLIKEEEDEEEKGAEADMEKICCFGVNLPHEPASMEEALAGDDREAWLASREDEFKSHMENETWTLTNLAPGRKALDCTWVLRVKSDAEGKLERRKTRLVIKVFQQREGIDFQEVFAPVAKAPTLGVFLAADAVCGWKVEQMDVKTAFLYGVVDEEIYMKQPEGYDDGSGRVCRLNKAIYGLKQAPRCWYARLVEALEALGFKVIGCDESLFMTEGEEEKVFLLVYVDDILFSPSQERIKEVQGKLKETFQCKALGPVGYLLPWSSCGAGRSEGMVEASPTQVPCSDGGEVWARGREEC
ncbi:unnamed protein product [Closterium sp. NIES-53]